MWENIGSDRLDSVSELLGEEPIGKNWERSFGRWRRSGVDGFDAKKSKVANESSVL
jgi:hypothetical protein